MRIIQVLAIFSSAVLNPNCFGMKGIQGKKSTVCISIAKTSPIIHFIHPLSTLLGMYHWCPSRDINSCLMDRQEAAMTVMQDHVIVAIFAETDSPLIGLRNLVMPMRASNIHYKDLVQVVIIGNVDYLKSTQNNCTSPQGHDTQRVNVFSFSISQRNGTC